MTMTLKTQYDTPDGSIDGGIQTWVADVERVETVRWVRLATWQHFYDAFVGMAGQQVHAYLESSVDVDVELKTLTLLCVYVRGKEPQNYLVQRLAVERHGLDDRAHRPLITRRWWKPTR